MGAIHLKRVYEHPEPGDGRRVLVDRLWPRGVAKKDAALDLWLKDVAPSPALRKWFGHDPARFQEFGKRYREELADNPEPVGKICDLAKDSDVTLLYAAHDPKINHAVVLAAFLAKRGCKVKRET